MGYNLTIDQGNSSAKVAVHDGLSIVKTERIECLDAIAIESLAKRYGIKSAIYSSVSVDGKEIVDALNRIGIKAMALTSDTPLPIEIDYKTPATLGRDRIAVAAGAYSEHPKCDVLIVDAGTAITYDVVTACGHYKGGNIAPGIAMRLASLHAHTKRLPLVDASGDVPFWGYDTDTAIRSGALHGVTAEINYYRRRLGDNAIVMLTGGDADIISPLLDFRVEVDAYLVNKGLNSILRYNESK